MAAEMGDNSFVTLFTESSLVPLLVAPWGDGEWGEAAQEPCSPRSLNDSQSWLNW